MTEVCLALAAAALLGAASLWLLRAPGRWVIAFLVAAVALPPLPFAIGGSGPHPALLVAAVGLLCGFSFLRSWRIPADSLSRALIIFFAILLFSVAPAMVYSGLEIGLATLARVALFGVSVYLFFYVTVGPMWRGHPRQHGPAVSGRLREVKTDLDRADTSICATSMRATRLLYWAA